MQTDSPTASALAAAAAIRLSVKALGSVFNPAVLAATREIYAPWIAQQPRDCVAVQQDQAYGPDARQVLDVYGDGASGPTVIFIHGGGFNAGNKRGDELFYANIGHYFAHHGVQAVLANYRLAPQFSWPAGLEDVQSVVAWAGRHLGAGGAGRPLILIGQSAGACHVAGYVFGASTASEATGRLAGCVLMSGVYRMSRVWGPGARAYFGEAPDLDAVRSPVMQVRATALPVLLTVSELDPADIAWHTFDLAQALTLANGQSPALQWFSAHNHVSTVHSLGSPQDEAGQALRAFVQACKPPA